VPGLPRAVPVDPQTANLQNPIEPLPGVGPDSQGLTRGLDYTLVLPEFEGPLDLLLHLVRKHELDIFNIPISFITRQYVLALEQMHGLNMDVAGEYLLMAATLAYIKSRELLPPEAQPAGEEAEGEDDEFGDPREALVRRLLEYQKFKGAAAELASRPVIGRNVWTREAAPESAFGDILAPAPLAEVPVWELIDLLAQLHGRRQKKLTHEVTFERLSLADRINQLNEYLDRAPLLEPVVSFDKALTNLAVTEPQADFFYQIVLTFLAMLEMARLRLLAIYQAQERGTIYLSRPGMRPPDLGGESAPPGPAAPETLPGIET
jgi:segregation and condensation protein A